MFSGKKREWKFFDADIIRYEITGYVMCVVFALLNLIHCILQANDYCVELSFYYSGEIIIIIVLFDFSNIYD